MKRFATLVLLLLIASVVALIVTSTAKDDPPKEIVFEAKNGKVTFGHAAHSERLAGKCDACHPKLFPKSREPINFKQGMHKPAEAAKASCAACHVAGGTAFETKGNCKKCHASKA